MRTRCRIGIMKNGIVESIYCHNDGYPSGVGQILFDHYKDRTTVERLMDLGDLSSLGTKPIANPDAWSSSAPPELMYRDDMCSTYRTRGETNIDKESTDYKQFVKTLSDGIEYLYLYFDDSWLCIYTVDTADSDDEPVCEQLEDALKRDAVI